MPFTTGLVGASRGTLARMKYPIVPANIATGSVQFFKKWIIIVLAFRFSDGKITANLRKLFFYTRKTVLKSCLPDKT